MKKIVAFTVSLGFALLTTYHAINNQLNTELTIVLLSFSIASGLAISNYDLFKRLKWKDFEIETFEREVHKISEDALSKIHEEVQKQKIKLENLNAKSERTKTEIETLAENILRYAFFVISPFTGEATTGGGYAKGTAFACSTDLNRLMAKARTQINDKQYSLALETKQKIEKIFPGFPGATHIEFLIYRDKNQQEKAIKMADELVATISKYDFSNIHPDNLADVYKYLIDWNLSNDRQKEASKIAEKALNFWPDDTEFKSAIQ